ncbi:unknown [Prevotella sp. CAG:617]|nr:unknown [Prevotella sp. CAG:617]
MADSCSYVAFYGLYARGRAFEGNAGNVIGNGPFAADVGHIATAIRFLHAIDRKGELTAFGHVNLVCIRLETNRHLYGQAADGAYPALRLQIKAVLIKLQRKREDAVAG